MSRPGLLSALCCCLLTGCAAPASTPATPTTGEAFAGDGQVSCSAVRPQSEPDLMAWDAGSRMNLNTLRTHGVVAVRYHAEGCNVELEVLSNCIGEGAYEYEPYASSDTKLARSAQELYAQFPLGAARLAGRLRGNRALRTDYELVGMATLPPGSTYPASNLKGQDCSRATHVVSRVYLGGFTMEAGEVRALEAGVSAFGARAGGTREASAERVFYEGTPEACAEARKTGEPQRLCSVPLRVGLLALEGASTPTATRPAAASTATATGRGPAMVRIPAGSFMMGSNDGLDDEKPVHRVTVSAFEMDVTEVTVAQYRSCVSTGTCEPPDSGVLCNYDGPSGKDNHPVNCVDWNQATAFCSWAGKRLPTEAEWEYAARGTDGRTYPWGNAEPATQLCWGSDDTCAVGSYPQGKSPFGLQDMAGNVLEWTSTQYCASYSPGAECDSSRVFRGGSWVLTDALHVRAALRSSHAPTLRNGAIGFRCARP